MKGKLYLVPTPLGDNIPTEVIPQYVFDSIAHIDNFIVEELRSARRFLTKIGFRGRIDELSFNELNEHTDPKLAESYIQALLEGRDVALISEAGLPAVADPGALVVEIAHRHDIEIVPMVGPSSLMLALMASGMNGQNFAFLGYIPVKTPQRVACLKSMEKVVKSTGQSQIFIETPYRNDSLLTDILNSCDKNTKLCIAADITLPSAYIKTKLVKEWQKSKIEIGKRPCVFIIGN